MVIAKSWGIEWRMQARKSDRTEDRNRRRGIWPGHEEMASARISLRTLIGRQGRSDREGRARGYQVRLFLMRRDAADMQASYIMLSCEHLEYHAVYLS